MNCTETNKLRAAIYRRAAKGMEDRSMGSGWSCWAICDAAGENIYNNTEKPPLIVREYESVFSPHAKHNHWWGAGWERDDKILALCLMAAMVEAGDA